jgi:hypothetical protein
MMIMHDYACIHMRVIQDDGYLNTFCVCLIHKVAVQANVLIHPYVPCSKYGWASISWESLYAGYKNSWIDDQPPMGKIQYPTNSTGSHGTSPFCRYKCPLISWVNMAVFNPSIFSWLLLHHPQLETQLKPPATGPSCARSRRPDVHGSEESGWDSFHPGANKDI